MRINKVILLCILAAVGLWGCGSPATDNNGAQPPHSNVGGDLGEAAKKAGGDYDKLSEADKQQLLKATNGDEKAARHLLKTMVMPAPTGPGGPPPR